MLAPSFRLDTKCKIDPGLVCLGRFDEEGYALAIGTSGNRVLVQRAEGKGGVSGPSQRFLNINREITALAAGKIAEEHERDTLLVGSPSSLLGYDVHDNCDKFFVDIPEGVRAIKFGVLPAVNKKPLTFVGGNCSLQGFDAQGHEKFWTVIGGNACALELCDFNADGTPELLVGSDDFEIRGFRAEESELDITETEVVSMLCRVGGEMSARFAYGLGNGTVGVYEGETRVWRVKAKDKILCMISFDLDGDGVEEIITGWSNGKFEARRNEDGQVVYRETFFSPVVALLKGDFRNSGTTELVCCLQNGEIRGYSPAQDSQQLSALGALSGGIKLASLGAQGFSEVQSPSANGDDAGDQVMAALKGSKESTKEDFESTLDRQRDPFAFGNEEDEDDEGSMFSRMQSQLSRSSGFESKEESRIRVLQEQLTLKLMELRSLEESIAKVKTGDNSRQVGLLPDGTNVTVEFHMNQAEGCLDLVVQVNNDCIIQNAVVFAFDSGIFLSECIATPLAKSGSGKRIVQLRPQKHGEADLKVEVLVSARGSAENQTVFEKNIHLPFFGTFYRTSDMPDINFLSKEDVGSVSFLLPSSAFANLSTVLRTLFGSPVLPDQAKLSSDQGIQLSLKRLGDDVRLVLTSRKETGSTFRLLMHCDSLELASQVVQELSKELGINQLESSADFPVEMKRLEELMVQVNELNDIRQRLGAEMADDSHFIKSLIIKAEDARMLHDISNVTQTYQMLTTLNRQLIGEYNKRSNNQQQLLDSLREVNQIIQRCSKLRVGKPQINVVSACRKAIKTNNLPALFHALTSATI